MAGEDRLGKLATGQPVTTVPGSVQLVPPPLFVSREVVIQASGTIDSFIWSPIDLKITSIQLASITAPASVAGTYVFTADGAGNNLLAAANFDLESLTSDTLETVPLTATAADLLLSAGDKLSFAFTSDNADLTGAGMHLQIEYVPQ